MRPCIHLVMVNVPRWPQTNSLTHQTWPILCLRLIIVIRKIWNPGESVAYIKTRKMSLHRRQTKILLWLQKSASSSSTSPLSTSPLSLPSSSLSSTSGSVFLWASSWGWMQTKVPNSFTSRLWLIGLGQAWSRTQHADLGGVLMPSCHEITIGLVRCKNVIWRDAGRHLAGNQSKITQLSTCPVVAISFLALG